MKGFFKKFIALALSLCVLLPLIGCDGCLNVNQNEVLPPSNLPSINYTQPVDKYSQNLDEAKLASAVNDVYQSVVYIENTISTSKKGRGCGVVVDIATEGESSTVFYVYTCYHVVEDFASLKVIFPYIPTYVDDNNKVQYDYANIDYDTYVFTSEGSSPKVGFVGGDRITDIAVLKVDISQFASTTVKNGKTIAPLVPVKAKVSNKNYTLGQTVFAIGNPTGELKGTVTSGVVSYINRDVNVESIGTMKLLQFDTPINAGNSGGGLFNLYGELVGIVNAGNNSVENIGFAVPITINSPTKDYGDRDTGFVNVAKQLIETAWSDGNGRYNYGYVKGRWQLGLTVGYDTNGAPYIVSVANDSIFYGTQVETNDYIRKVSYYKDGQKVNYNIGASGDKLAGDVFNEVYEMMKADLNAGDSVTITFSDRLGQDYSVTATLKQIIYRDTGMGLGN
jgi:serine protease Do